MELSARELAATAFCWGHGESLRLCGMLTGLLQAVPAADPAIRAQIVTVREPERYLDVDRALLVNDPSRPGALPDELGMAR